MKQLFSFFILLLIGLTTRGMDAYFKHAVFYEPEYGAYVETHMLFNGAALGFAAVEADSTYQSSVELTYIFLQDGNVAQFSKNIVRGPYINDTLEALQNFVDQQRFVLAPGSYTLDIKLKDLNNPADSAHLTKEITVDIPADKAFFSDIILAGSAEETTQENIYSRVGYDIVPKVSSFYRPQDNELIYYSELYQTDIDPGKDEAFILRCDLVNLESEQEISEYHSMERQSGQGRIPVLKRFDISDLANGNYLLRLEARNRSNEVIASKALLIQRMNDLRPPDSLAVDELQSTFVSKFTNLDSLRQMAYCLRPQSENAEEGFIDLRLDTASMEQVQRFFYGFWYDRNPMAPESEWLRYYEQVKVVARNYSTKYRHGCATDQGRVYLEYGKPDGKIDRPRTSLFYPYEMWHYYATPRRANAKFVFYDPTLGTGSSYVLLHSNIIGEQADYNWFYTLQQRAGIPNTNDEAAPFDTYGVNPVEDFNLPP